MMDVWVTVSSLLMKGQTRANNSVILHSWLKRIEWFSKRFSLAVVSNYGLASYLMTMLPYASSIKSRLLFQSSELRFSIQFFKNYLLSWVCDLIFKGFQNPKKCVFVKIVVPRLECLDFETSRQSESIQIVFYGLCAL